MTVTEIESAIEKLSPLEEFEARVWDKQIERDLQNGNLQSSIEEAEKDFAELIR